jgi:hypothetical protein
MSKEIGDVGCEAPYDRLFISGDIIPILIFSFFELGQPEEDVVACP